jgi:hypothetical protein
MVSLGVHAVPGTRAEAAPDSPSPELDPADSDDPGHRDVALATYQDCDDFLYRLPMYIRDVARMLESRMAQAEANETRLRDGRRAVRALQKGAGGGD